MIKNPAHTIEVKYIRQIQQQQIELALLKAERDAAVRDRDVAQARSAAMRILIDALARSLRPYGFARKRFLMTIRKAANAVPNHGPAALQHEVLFEGSNRILKRTDASLTAQA
ncbi:hypothetical protein SAMN05216360_103174 [Methylobacterium phyllostachyos]|uniref:Uncharacterized protein n=1 Tax=Methylobacterium phyllostachyos TaxID=582672 RepID=A0A1G9VGI5_9HYPH|nr:hypothetical protein [Methylobacterium phyllostachyos]SDM70935.1 hypothetical protein SAMN05216360_103174 [Methylobacterium phyllostachyos]